MRNTFITVMDSIAGYVLRMFHWVWVCCMVETDECLMIVIGASTVPSALQVLAVFSSMRSMIHGVPIANQLPVSWSWYAQVPGITAVWQMLWRCIRTQPPALMQVSWFCDLHLALLHDDHRQQSCRTDGHWY